MSSIVTKRAKKAGKPKDVRISLYPLTLEQALRGALGVKPEELKAEMEKCRHTKPKK